MPKTFFSLLILSSEKKGLIVFLDGGFGFQQKLASLNIRVGKTVTKITSQPFSGPVVILVDNTEISLGRKIASRIFVEELE